MADCLVTAGEPLKGEITVPGDKSISHRSLMLSAIASGQSIIQQLSFGEDILSTLNALQHLGVNYSGDQQELRIIGKGLHGLSPCSAALNLNNSGTSMRLLCGLLSGQRFSSQLIGDDSLTNRPMGRIAEPLNKMGADISMSDRQTAPLFIQGGRKLTGLVHRLPIASAQVKSGLLLAGLYAKGRTTIVEPAVTRDHTERMLIQFGRQLEQNKNQVSIVGGIELNGTTIVVPGDFSSAAFFIVAAVVTPDSEIVIKNVGINPTRLGLIHILRKMGAEIEIEPINRDPEPIGNIWVRYQSQLTGIEIPNDLISLAIDELPILFIAAACAKGDTILRGASELRVKESDRLATMSEGFTQLGIEHRLFPDGMGIRGGEFKGGIINSFGDHRIAMSFAISGSVAGSPVTIKDCDPIKVSFPNFVAVAQKLGMNMKTFTNL